ncbi:helix-turn-helix domain-containing protein [Limosilactobacillus reuteri]|uniref:helix-turn-helix domain-containing protein n=1 Tax=Limosilactobacillus reuteri TaxID=1598 RepID=UPI00128B5E6C|nr:XRE family transcriptional regulator [Limosilactobacillus reuteri]MQB60228.1 transcriptional regulator [Limosilactobacillus reuteri]MQB76038.1 transcriptional regulator [Limosilactobacillus reuteri]MQB99441.1 transcriptional regulator [Limosilactobacillus reuteri]
MIQTEKTLFNPQNLTYARIARGFTMKLLSEKSGISRQTISSYESGKSVPRGKSLLKLSQILNFPITFFNAKMSHLGSEGTFFRSRTSSTKKARDKQKVRLIFSSNIYDLLSEYVNFPNVNIPSPIEEDLDNITNEKIKKLALLTRKKWGLDNEEPINNLTKLIEANGIIISQANLREKKIDAVSKWVADRPFILLTDNRESGVRRRFNIAHELGHILLHSNIESIYELSNTDMNELEHQANVFASNLLLPDQAFIRSVVSTSMEGFIELKKYWKVSIAALIMKARKVELLSENQYLYLNKKLSYNHWRRIEPLDDSIPIETPDLYNAVCKLIINNNVMSKQGLKAKMKLPNDELKALISPEFASLDQENKSKSLKLHIIE